MFKKIERNKNLYEIVVDELQNMIFNEVLKKGDRLPSERELSEKFQISRATVREALKALHIMGLIETRHGDGNYVKGSFTDAIYEPLSMIFYLEENNPYKLLEFRKIIEVGAAELAALYITEEEIRELEKIVQELNMATNEDESVNIDTLFHLHIAKASKNVLLIEMCYSMARLFDDYIKEYRRIILSNGDEKDTIAYQHEAIFKAIKNHDQAMARKAMQTHLDFIELHLNMQQSLQIRPNY